MANILEYLKHIKPVYRRSSNAMKIFVIVIILLGIAGLFVLRHATNVLEEQNAVLESTAQQLEQENAVLEEKIGIQGTKQAVIQIAQEVLGLVEPDTVLIRPGEGTGN